MTIDPSILCANLRRVRTARKLSQGELAANAGLSREGYRRIEDGEVEPRVNSLTRIAAVLSVKTEDLLVPVRALHAVRFRAQKKMTTREDLLATVARWLDDYADLEAIVGERATFKLASLAQRLKRERPDAVAAAREAREALGLHCDGRDEVIRDLCGLLEDNGVKVFTPSVASEGFFGLSVAAADGGPAIIVNRWDRISVERWIFTAAHELGHLLLHLDAYDVTEQAEDPAQEKDADVFAAQFLMPDSLFDREWQEARGLGLVDRVFKVKRIFKVSWKTVVYRIAARSPEPARVWAQFYKDYRRQYGRPLRGIDEPHPLETADFMSAPAPVPRAADEDERLSACDFVEDRLLRLVRTAVERGDISLGRAAEILGEDLKTVRTLASAWLE